MTAVQIDNLTHRLFHALAESLTRDAVEIQTGDALAIAFLLVEFNTIFGHIEKYKEPERRDSDERQTSGEGRSETD